MDMVVKDDVSSKGLHRLHVVRGGSMKEEQAARWAAGWIERRVDRTGGVLEGSFVYEEPGMGMWNLRLYWKDEVEG
jgi:hypothetical protein